MPRVRFHGVTGGPEVLSNSSVSWPIVAYLEGLRRPKVTSPSLSSVSLWEQPVGRGHDCALDFPARSQLTSQ